MNLKCSVAFKLNAYYLDNFSRIWKEFESEKNYFTDLKKEMATHSSVLARRIPGMEEPGGLPSMGSHRVGHNWSNFAAAATPSPLPVFCSHATLSGWLPCSFTFNWHFLRSSIHWSLSQLCFSTKAVIVIWRTKYFIHSFIVCIFQIRLWASRGQQFRLTVVPLVPTTVQVPDQ